ncbi:MAG: HAMP domain-containing histidine kinase [Proteobacteria bacterium]|nr:HAMP domain-containing histidine kinase [Pseudomonadota bacterium]
MDTRYSLPSENAINLQRLLWMRLIVLPGVLLALWVARAYMHAELPVTTVLVVLTIMAVISVATQFRLRWLPSLAQLPVSKVELFAQLVLDVTLFTILLYLSGGSTNPFAPAYLLPLAMTVVALPGIYVWAMFALTASCYTFLLYYFVPLPMAHAHGFEMHVWGMWAGFMFSAGLFATFATRVAATVRARDKMIADMREQQARQDKVVALGTLAAGAAHELGTPLSTMAVLLKEMQSDEVIDKNNISTLQSQLGRCKTILATLSASAGGLRAESGGSEAVDGYINRLMEQWRELRPDAKAELIMFGETPAPHIMADRTLDQAIINVLNNAADASIDDIVIEVGWDKNVMDIKVLDRGPGLAQELVDAAGKIILSTKQEGLGVGLYLSYTTLERLGGEIRMYNREHGGACCQLHLPLTALKVD